VGCLRQALLRMGGEGTCSGKGFYQIFTPLRTHPEQRLLVRREVQEGDGASQPPPIFRLEEGWGNIPTLQPGQAVASILVAASQPRPCHTRQTPHLDLSPWQTQRVPPLPDLSG
jgi:hypothetical protein